MWINVLNGNDILHVIPIDDLKEHESKETCFCNPWKDEEGFYVHNSADNRELTEGLPMS